MLLKFLMEREELTYRQLAEKLNGLGIEENERNLRNKISKGEMSAAMFLILMKVLKAKNLPMESLPVLGDDIGADLTARPAISLPIDENQ